ncbi:MAG: LysE family translocator [Pseudomonadota bacterium]
MPALDTMLAVALAGLALSVTPGPSMLYVLSRSVGQSRAAGLASALGLGLGGTVLAVATAMGLAAVFAAFKWMIPTLRIAGSAYLVWLGISMIRDARAAARVKLVASDVRQRSFFEIVRQGILVEVLNPKTVLFFALFLPPFVDDALDADVSTQLLVLGVLVPLTAIPSDLVVAWLGGTLSEAVNSHQTVREGLAWLGGLTLIAIAANIHLGVI